MVRSCRLWFGLLVAAAVVADLRPVFEDDEWDFTHVTGLPVPRSRAPQRPGERAPQKDPLTHLPPVLARHRQHRDPLPAELAGSLVSKRLANGWDPGDPLLTVTGYPV